VSHALLPAFTLAWRLDVTETVGAVIGQVAGGGCGVRPAAARAGVPYTTARGWVRRFRARALELGTGFAALAVELGGEAIRPAAEAGRFALAAVGAAFAVAAGLPGWLRLGAWRFASSVSGGRLIAANTGSPFLVWPANGVSCLLSHRHRHEGGTSWITRVRNRSHCTAGR
jgi:hypothetical protein